MTEKVRACRNFTSTSSPCGVREQALSCRQLTSWEMLKLKLGTCGLSTAATANGFPPFVRWITTLLNAMPSTSEAHLRCSILGAAAVH